MYGEHTGLGEECREQAGRYDGGRRPSEDAAVPVICWGWERERSQGFANEGSALHSPRGALPGREQSGRAEGSPTARFRIHKSSNTRKLKRSLWAPEQARPLGRRYIPSSSSPCRVHKNPGHKIPGERVRPPPREMTGGKRRLSTVESWGGMFRFKT